VAIRVLVIEDDADLREMLKLLLEDEEFTVIEADSGEQGLRVAASDPVDLILLDLKLPDISGFEVCRQLRSRSDIPIIVVTAQVDSFDMVAGLTAGADDYVTKPFVGKVLVARIRALLRRVQGGDEAGRLHFGELEIAPQEGYAARRGERLQLTKTEFRLLCDLAEHRNHVISRELLLQRVWGYDYPGDGRLVDSHIRRLRTKVEEDPAYPKLILTVRGLGYKLDAG
jgi:DNA-binding response OmpR family regulator